MALQTFYKSLVLEKDKKSFLKGYHVDFDGLHLFINLSIADFDFESEATIMAESFLEIIQKHITEENEQKIYDRFEEGLKEINFFLQDLKSKKESGNIGTIDAVMGLLDERTLYLTKTGLAESYLLRKGNIIEISEGLYNNKGSDANFFVNIASGDLESGDKVLFASKRLLKFVGKSDLNNVFINTDLEGSFQELQSALSVEDTGDMMVSGFVAEKTHIDAHTSNEYEEGSGIISSVGSFPAQSGGQKVLDISKKAFATGKSVTMNVVKGMKDPAKRRNYLILAGIAVIAILLLNFTVFSNNTNNDPRQEQYRQLLRVAEEKLTNARSQRVYDAKLSKQSLDDAKKNAVEVHRSGLFYADAQRLLDDIQHEEELLDRIINIVNPTVFVQLDKKDPAVDAQELVNFNQGFYVVTPNTILGPIVDAAPDSYLKSSPLENGETVVAADKFLDRSSLVLFTRGSKLVEFKDNNFTFMDTDDTTWKTAVDIRTYGNRQYVYLLDPANNNIWRYERANQKYRKAFSYNTDKVDIKDGVSFAIDGSIYVLRANGEVKRFLSQKAAPFTIEGGPSIPLQNLDSRAKIYTNENLRNIYILDPVNQRLLVYKKVTFEKPEKMTYDRQFVVKNMELRDFWVDDAEQNLYFLTQKQILKIDMKTLAP